MAVSSQRWSQGPTVLPLLIFLLTRHATPIFCLDHTQSWTVCGADTLDRPLILQAAAGTCPLASDWSPWSRQPFCLESVEDEDMLPADCVFTLTEFRGHQGISLITTPDLAASIVEYLDDSRVSQWSGQQLTAASQGQQNETLPYEVRELPGRGKGIVARKRITKHEIIMIGFPVLVIRLDFINGNRYTQRQKRLLMETSVKQLPSKQQKSLMSLAKTTGGEFILDILRTNGFGIEINGVQHLALFIDGSRVNHNCRPNSFWRYIKGNMGMEVVALRDITPGEEVTHSYAPLGYTHEERRAVLQAWGFQCRCALCSAQPADRELSDRRRERLLEIHRTLGQSWTLGSQRVAELVLEAFRLIEQEELHPQLVEYYQQFAKSFLIVKELRKARDFTRKADEMWRLYGGEEHENVDGISELWKEVMEAEKEDMDG